MTRIKQTVCLLQILIFYILLAHRIQRKKLYKIEGYGLCRVKYQLVSTQKPPRNASTDICPQGIYMTRIKQTVSLLQILIFQVLWAHCIQREKHHEIEGYGVCRVKYQLVGMQKLPRNANTDICPQGIYMTRIKQTVSLLQILIFQVLWAHCIQREKHHEIEGYGLCRVKYQLVCTQKPPRNASTDICPQGWVSNYTPHHV